MKELYIVCKALRGRFTKICLMTPITWLHYQIFWSVWVLRLKSESKMTPKCFWWERLAIFLSWNLTMGCDKSFETNLCFHWLAHLVIFCKSALSSATDLSKSRTLEKEKYHQQKLCTLKLFHQVDHLYKSETKVVLIPIIVEFQN